MQHMQAGVYDVTLGMGTLNEEKSGALMFYVVANFGEFEQRYGFCLVNKAGEIMQKTVNEVYEILNGAWADKTDLSQLLSIDCGNAPAKAVVQDEEYNGKMYSKIAFINPPNGGGAGASLPASNVNAQTIASKYGAKFRAAFPKPTGASSAKTPPAKTPPPSAKPPPSVPKAKTGGTAKSDANACWSALNAKMSGQSDTEIADAWLKWLNGRDAGNVTPAQWGAFADEIAAMNTDPAPF